jgi:hypothetical protein
LSWSDWRESLLMYFCSQKQHPSCGYICHVRPSIFACDSNSSHQPCVTHMPRREHAFCLLCEVVSKSAMWSLTLSGEYRPITLLQIFENKVIRENIRNLKCMEYVNNLG